MANFAVIDKGIIVNLIVADTKEIAEQVTGKECFEFSANDRFNIGDSYPN